MAAQQISDFFTNIVASGSDQGLADNKKLTALVRQLTSYSTTGLTAYTTGGQTAATLANSFINLVSTVATTSASVMLAPAYAGAWCFLINNGAQTMQVYGNSNNPATGLSDSITSHTSTAPAVTTTGVAQTSGLIAAYVCFAVGKWKQFLTA